MVFFYVTELTNVCNYAVDTTFHDFDSDIWSLIKKLEHDSLNGLRATT